MKKVFAVLIIIMLSYIPFIYAEQGPYTDEITFIHYLDESVAVQEVKAKNLDMYYFRLPLEVVSSVKDDPAVRVYQSTGGSMGLLLNPAPATDTLNPFSIKEVRYAMNYLIDREFVVNEILKGSGTPMYSAFSLYDPDYLVLLDTIESFNFSYNPQLAEKMIADALTKAGATKSNGVWTFNERPIEIKIFIRGDDPARKALGELVSSELEKVGFKVIKDFGDLKKAFTVIYSSNPALQEWHIYTEGYGGRAGFVRYDSSVTAQMYSPWFGNMPGWQNMEPGFWNYQNAEIDEITQRIFTGNFTSEEERNKLLNDAVRIGINESVRLFVASLIDPYVARSDLEGIVNDFSAGITSRFTLINSRTPDERPLKIGVKQIYQGAWNPVGGFSDVYASRIWYALFDPDLFQHPYTGEVISVRSAFDVETAGPNGKLSVPSDAIIWDPYDERWVNVGEGVSAISKVVYDLSYSKWHHGVSMDKNDILYSIYFAHEWGTNEGPDDKTVDPDYTSTVEPRIKTIKGYRFLSDNKVEVYFDYWHFNEGEIASYGSVWSSMPWEIIAAMERVVIDGKAAFSRSAANSKNIDWLSLIIEGNAKMVKDALEGFKSEGFVPAALEIEDAKDRYDAAIKWIEEKHHAVISNGPFYLLNYNPEARSITIKAFRDTSYPFEVGRWKELESAQVATIEKVEPPLSIRLGSEIIIPGAVKYDGDYNDVKLYYLFKDSNGKVVVNGNTSLDMAGKFSIKLSPDDTSKLSAGSNTFKLLAISKKALKPDVYGTSIIGVVQAEVQTTAKDEEVTQPKSGCLIATAAFGSELDPYVQLLRNFRDNRILSTAAGSSFMNAFNAWYYSFSPYVADYERSNPLMQQIVRNMIYPLIGILLVSENAYDVLDGEYGAVTAGLVASSMIGALYFSPLALVIKRIRRVPSRLLLLSVAFSLAILIIGILLNNPYLLIFSSVSFVLSTLATSATFTASLYAKVIKRVTS